MGQNWLPISLVDRTESLSNVEKADILDKVYLAKKSNCQKQTSIVKLNNYFEISHIACSVQICRAVIQFFRAL